MNVPNSDRMPKDASPTQQRELNNEKVRAKNERTTFKYTSRVPKIVNWAISLYSVERMFYMFYAYHQMQPKITDKQPHTKSSIFYTRKKYLVNERNSTVQKFGQQTQKYNQQIH